MPTNRLPTAIQTRLGYDMYVDVLRTLSEGGKRKVTDKKIAVEFNKRVDAKLETVSTAAERKVILEGIGFVTETNVKRHRERLAARMVRDTAQQIRA